MSYGRSFLVVAAAAVATASVASAATLQFSTTGSFTTLPAGTDTDPAPNVVKIGDSTLTFTGATTSSNAFTSGNNFSNFPSLPFTFGSFSLASTFVNPPDDFSTTTFSLLLTQSIPTPTPNTPANLTATIDGSIAKSNDGVIISFATPTASFNVAGVGTYTYTIDTSEVVGVGTTVSIGGRVNLPAGAPTIAPLPPAALGGAGLCGLMFGFRRLKQRIAA